MLNSHRKSLGVGDARQALAPAVAAGPSLAQLALRLVGALLRLGWRRAAKVLSVGDCNVH